MIIREDKAKGRVTIRAYNNINDPVEKAIGRQCIECKDIFLRHEMSIDNSRKDKMNRKCIGCNANSTRQKSKESHQRLSTTAAYKKRKSDWQKDNPDRCADISHNRRARNKANGGEFSYEEWATLRQLFNNKCPLSNNINKLTRDHFIPIAKGGLNDKTNIVPLDSRLNTSKHASNPFVWIETQPAEYYPGFWKCVEYLANQNGMTVKEYVEFVESFFEK